MVIHFAHCRNPKNTGDMECTPYQYFDFFKNRQHNFIDIADFHEYNPDVVKPEDCVIIGGGGIDRYHEVWQTRINELIHKARLAIGWGFGINDNPSYNNPITTKIDYEAFKLLGTRDFIETRGEYVPCVSCMNKSFDSISEIGIKRKYGVVAHYESIVNLGDFSRDSELITNSQPMSKIIRFMAESEVILSNSYHICYWAVLMEKPIFRITPSEGDGRFNLCGWDLNGNVDRNKSTLILKKAREINGDFASRVFKTITSFEEEIGK